MDGWMDAKAGSSPFHVFQELSLGGLVTMTSPVPYLIVSKCLDPVLLFVAKKICEINDTLSQCTTGGQCSLGRGVKQPSLICPKTVKFLVSLILPVTKVNSYSSRSCWNNCVEGIQTSNLGRCCIWR